MNKCDICGNDKNNKYYVVKEMQIGLLDEFDYLECGSCGCLHILSPPEDLSKYYPKDYYSLMPLEIAKTTRIQRFFFNLRVNSTSYMYTNQGGLINKLMCKFLPNLLSPIKPAAGVLDKKILDVGCGHGELLKILSYAGFRNLCGVDPFIEKEIIYEHEGTQQVKIYKKELYELDDTFDIIMLNHSLEHMPEQEKVLQRLYSMLNESGVCIIRIPTASSKNWHKYKEHWYVLDAPRHLYLHTVNSITLVAQKSGFRVASSYREAVPGDFHSRAYQRGWNYERISKFLYSPLGLPFLLKEILFVLYTNRKGGGDALCIHLERKE